MKILVVGCGRIGASIIQSLVKEGHDVVAVDGSKTVIEEIGNIYDVMCVCGNGADCETLAEAGVAGAELLVAVTGSDEFNMLSCFIGSRMGAKNTIARIRNPEYNDKSLGFMRNQLEISTSINPEWIAAKELFNILKMPAAANIENFSRGNLEMVEIPLKTEASPLHGLSLIELRKKFDAKFLVCAVQRGEQCFIPGASFVLQNGDIIGICAAQSELQKLFKQLGVAKRQAKNVVILGASRTAFYLAKRLISGGSNVKIIDKDPLRCRVFAQELGDAVVICGDGAEQELLLEEGLDSADAFVALTGNDELNILISIFAQTKNVQKVIAKVNRSELATMAKNLGLDTLLSPKKIVSDVLSRYARALQNSLGSNIETLYTLMDGSVEALEFSVGSDFKGAGIPLKELSLKKGILVAGIIRGRKATIPFGDDTINIGDRVVVISADKGMTDLSDILA